MVPPRSRTPRLLFDARRSRPTELGERVERAGPRRPGTASSFPRGLPWTSFRGTREYSGTSHNLPWTANDYVTRRAAGVAQSRVQARRPWPGVGRIGPRVLAAPMADVHPEDATPEPLQLDGCQSGTAGSWRHPPHRCPQVEGGRLRRWD